MSQTTDLTSNLPTDGFAGALIGRAWVPASFTGTVGGPCVVWIRNDGVFDLSPVALTCAELLNEDFDHRVVDRESLRRIGSYDEIIENTMNERDPERAYFLSPVDLQAIKACGVTFMVSMLERVIEERARGDASRAEAVRGKIKERIGTELTQIMPGSEDAAELKVVLQSEGLWSQYIEVGIGPYAEVFTKAQPMSSVGTGANIGILPISYWNNPEPEVVLLVNAEGNIVGATLGNDVNLRDIEGRSALLLGKAKDNNASCAIGPFIRLFDESFGLDDVRSMTVSLRVQGDDGFELDDSSDMSLISRDVEDLVQQTINKNHQYPDGLALFTGTMFAPTKDRMGEGSGFTHQIGDIVQIYSDKLGRLENRVSHSHEAPPWKFGMLALLKNLSQRGLL